MISVKVFRQVLLKGVVVVGGSCGMCVGGGRYKGTLFFSSSILSAAAIECCVTK